MRPTGVVSKKDTGARTCMWAQGRDEGKGSKWSVGTDGQTSPKRLRAVHAGRQVRQAAALHQQEGRSRLSTHQRGEGVEVDHTGGAQRGQQVGCRADDGQEREACEVGQERVERLKPVGLLARRACPAAVQAATRARAASLQNSCCGCRYKSVPLGHNSRSSPSAKPM